MRFFLGGKKWKVFFYPLTWKYNFIVWHYRYLKANKQTKKKRLQASDWCSVRIPAIDHNLPYIRHKYKQTLLCMNTILYTGLPEEASLFHIPAKYPKCVLTINVTWKENWRWEAHHTQIFSGCLLYITFLFSIVFYWIWLW